MKRFSDSNNSLVLDFFILEKGDGIVAQIIYEGDPDTHIEISGTIEGVSNFFLDPNIEISYIKYNPYFIVYFIPFILVVLFYRQIDVFLNYVIEKEKIAKEKSIEKRLSFFLNILFGSLFIIFLMYFIFFVIDFIPSLIRGVSIPISDYLDI